MVRVFIEHFQMKNGCLKESEISKQLNFNGYWTENGYPFSPGIVRSLVVTYLKKQKPDLGGIGFLSLSVLTSATIPWELPVFSGPDLQQRLKK